MVHVIGTAILLPNTPAEIVTLAQTIHGLLVGDGIPNGTAWAGLTTGQKNTRISEVYALLVQEDANPGLRKLLNTHLGIDP